MFLFLTSTVAVTVPVHNKTVSETAEIFLDTYPSAILLSLHAYTYGSCGFPSPVRMRTNTS